MKRKILKWWWRFLYRLACGRTRGHAEPLSEEELAIVFSIARDEQWFAAVCQVIRAHVADNVEIFSDPALVNRPGSLASESGAVGALLSLLRDLETRRAASSNAQPEVPEEIR